MKIDLTKVAPEIVAGAYLTDHPIATSLSLGRRRVREFWHYSARARHYLPIDKALLASSLIKWLGHRFVNLKRLEVQHIERLIVDSRFVGCCDRQWLVTHSAGWRVPEIRVTPEAIVNAAGERQEHSWRLFNLFFDE